MSRHTPWTNEQSEKWADEGAFCDRAWRLGFLAGMAKAAEMIEECETIRYTLRDGKPHTGSFEVFEANLVGVREIDKGEA